MAPLSTLLRVNTRGRGFRLGLYECGVPVAHFLSATQHVLHVSNDTWRIQRFLFAKLILLHRLTGKMYQRRVLNARMRRRKGVLA